jgi:transposase
VRLSMIAAVGSSGRPAAKRNKPRKSCASRFCQLFREFERRLSPTMRQQHVAGHKVFVDYSGKQVPIIDRGYAIRRVLDSRLAEWTMNATRPEREAGRSFATA